MASSLPIDIGFHRSMAGRAGADAAAGADEDIDNVNARTCLALLASLTDTLCAASVRGYSIKCCFAGSNDPSTHVHRAPELAAAFSSGYVPEEASALLRTNVRYAPMTGLRDTCRYQIMRH